MKNRRIWAVVLTLILLVSMLIGGRPQSSGEYPLGERISNSGQVVAAIRGGIRRHASQITVRFDYGSDIFDELNEVIDAWVEAALEETERPDEGDYLRYQYGGYTSHSSYVIREGRWYYTVEITPVYYCTLRQQQEAEEAFETALRQINRERRRDPEAARSAEAAAIRAVYEYVCATVRYDKPHRKNPYYHLCSTSYAALVQHTATCQGYCVTLYRLLRACGVDCRIVTGSAGEESLHAWVIARVGSKWYHLDPTWDAGTQDPSEFRYFLVGTEAFGDHIPGEKFTTDEFCAACPMAEQNWR